jgi:hypothetical protein
VGHGHGAPAVEDRHEQDQPAAPDPVGPILVQHDDPFVVGSNRIEARRPITAVTVAAIARRHAVDRGTHAKFSRVDTDHLPRMSRERRRSAMFFSGVPDGYPC